MVAAGSGHRMRGIDKVFAPVAGKPLIAHVLEVFQACDSIQQIVLMLNQKNLGQGIDLAKQSGYFKIRGVYQGGDRRQDSVAAGLERLDDCQWVVIHDGARPCLSRGLIVQGLQEARESGAAIAGVPARDTIKRIGPGGIVERTLRREGLWLIQTPQVFRRDLLVRAYQQATGEVTDDATLLENLGYRVKVYLGSYANIKVTVPEDLKVAEAILQDRDAGRYRL